MTGNLNLTEQSQRITKLAMRVTALEKWSHEPFDFSALIARIDKLEARMPDADDMGTALGTIGKLRVTVNTQNALISNKSTEIAALQGAVRDRDKEIDRLMTDIETKNATITELRELVRQHEKEVRSIGIELADTQRSLRDCEGMFETLSAAGRLMGKGPARAVETPENPPESEAVGIWPNIEIVRNESEQPVPSHGGPARRVVWSLRVNGVEIAHEDARFAWDYEGVGRYEDPMLLKHTKGKLESALHGKTNR